MAAIVGLVLVIARCSSSTPAPTDSSPPAEAVGNAQKALESAVSEQKPIPVEPLTANAVRRGGVRVITASKEGLAGEMIYSQNCYDVVGRRFSWGKLDECGGFDVEAGLALGDEAPPGADKEVAWFDSEAGAGRYLKAAIAAGLDSDAADQRLAALQAMIAARHKAKSTSPSAKIVVPAEEPDGGQPPQSGDKGSGAA
ncbi:hypothetical protein AQZ52_09860 [Novosphingobium fuchskuhlense]|uniref:Uncharacterized protein n=1 Tax=Novosphingobium fuchskuhlense TaxID=1117702 RepID=A0A117UUC0_9SPHN|nr:hypothetical protein [Novosphingobium fuchskuhlense]KUR71004.1 hypothetical protein AQZ52_09860 [Novosphingobium fuchskuhlense]